MCVLEGVSLPNFTQNKRESSPYRWYCVDVSCVIMRQARSDAERWFCGDESIVYLRVNQRHPQSRHTPHSGNPRSEKPTEMKSNPRVYSALITEPLAGSRGAVSEVTYLRTYLLPTRWWGLPNVVVGGG